MMEEKAIISRQTYDNFMKHDEVIKEKQREIERLKKIKAIVNITTGLVWQHDSSKVEFSDKKEFEEWIMKYRDYENKLKKLESIEIEICIIKSKWYYKLFGGKK